MTLIGHGISGLALFSAFHVDKKRGPFGLPKKVALWLVLLLPMLPDLDIIMHIWVRYEHPFGHRGAFHSLFFAVVFGICVAGILWWRKKIIMTRRNFWAVAAAASILIASHDITDSMTDGGKGVALWWPLTTKRVFAPVRVIPVSPMGKSLLRTEFKPKTYEKYRRYRERAKTDTRPHHIFKDWAILLVDNPEHARRMAVLGIGATEAVLFAPLVVIGIWRRRRRRTADDDDDDEPTAEPTGPPAAEGLWNPGKGSMQLAVGATAIAALVTLGLLIAGRGTGSSEHTSELKSMGTSLTEFVPDGVTPGPDSPTVVLLHGWRCSPEMMRPLARMLAESGLVVLNATYPGHSGADQPLDLTCSNPKERPCREGRIPALTAYTQKLIAALIKERGYTQLAAIGHSIGASALARMGPADPALKARIALDGRMKPDSLNHNILSVAIPRVHRKLPGAIQNQTVGDVTQGTAYKLVSKKMAHLNFINDAETNALIVDWLSQTFGQTYEVKRQPDIGTRRAAGVASIVLWALLLGAGLMFARQRKLIEPGPVMYTARPGWGVVFLLLGSICAAMHYGSMSKAGTVWLMKQENLVAPVFLAVCGLWIALPYALTFMRKKPWGFEPRVLGRDVAIGIGAVVLFYLVVVPIVQAGFFHLAIGPLKWGRFLFWWMAIVPIALFVQEMGPQRPGWWRVLLRLALRCVAWAVLCWVVAARRDGRLDYETLTMAVGLAVLEVGLAMPRELLRSRVVPAVAVAGLFAAIVAASYPVQFSSTL